MKARCIPFHSNGTLYLTSVDFYGEGFALIKRGWHYARDIPKNNFIPPLWYAVCLGQHDSAKIDFLYPAGW